MSANGELIGVGVATSVILIILLFATIARNSPITHNKTEIIESQYTVIGSDKQELMVVKVDGCEYIRSPVHSGYLYTHKGNCKNSIHVYQRWK